MNIAVLADIFNAVIGIFLVILSTKLVLRTEKKLDRAAKFFLAASITFLVATLLEMNAYLGFFVPDTSFMLSSILFTIAITFFAFGGYTLYGITRDK